MNSNPKIRTVFRAFIGVLAMIVIWMSSTAVMAGLGNLDIRPSVLPFICIAAIVFFMLLSAFVTEIFLVYVDDSLWDMPGLRFMLFLMTGLTAFTVFFLSDRYGFKGDVVAALSTANLLVFSCLCATWMTSALKKPSELVPVCAVVALADLASVLAGPTRHLAQDIAAYYEKGMEGPPPLSDYILVKITVPGLSAPLPLFGVSDWIILVFLCSAMLRFGLNDNLTGRSLAELKKKQRLSFYVPVAGLGLAAAVLSAQLTGLFLPALPFMVMFFLGHALFSHETMRKLSAREWKLTAAFSLTLVSLLMAALYLRS